MVVERVWSWVTGHVWSRKMRSGPLYIVIECWWLACLVRELVHPVDGVSERTRWSHWAPMAKFKR